MLPRHCLGIVLSYHMDLNQLVAWLKCSDDDLVQWLFGACLPKIVSDCFVLCCSSGKLKEATRLANITKLELPERSRAFRSAYRRGYTDICQWLYNTFPLWSDEHRDELNRDFQELYYHGCLSPEYNSKEQELELSSTTRECGDAQVFAYFYEDTFQAYSHTAEWFHQHFLLAQTNPKQERASVLVRRHDKHFLNFLRWIFDRVDRTPRAPKYESSIAFRAACGFGYLRTAKWLLKRFSIDGPTKAQALEEALENECRDVTGWLQNVAGL